MHYITVKRGKIVGSPHLCHTSLKTADGKIISGFDNLPVAEQIKHGEYPFKDDSISYDARIQRLGDPQYEINQTGVTVRRQVIDIDLETLRSRKIDQIYKKATAMLDAQAEGYPKIQIAAWPLIQAEVLAYNENSQNVGAAMTAAMQERALTADELSAIVTPKMIYKDAVYANRNRQVSAVKALQTPFEIAEYDTGSGWPELTGV